MLESVAGRKGRGPLSGTVCPLPPPRFHSALKELEAERKGQIATVLLPRGRGLQKSCPHFPLFPAFPRARAKLAGVFHQTALGFFPEWRSLFAGVPVDLFVCFKGVRRSFLDVSFSSPFHSSFVKRKLKVRYPLRQWASFLKAGVGRGRKKGRKGVKFDRVGEN